VRASKRRLVEIESLAEFDDWVAGGLGSTRGLRVQAVDLRRRSDVLLSMDPSGAMFLGCLLGDKAEQHLRDGGALVFPAIPDVPFDPYRGHLYTPDELYAGIEQVEYAKTPDAVIYAWASRVGSGQVDSTLARAMHDHAIDNALEDLLRVVHAGPPPGTRVVGVMGGHAIGRGDPEYADAVGLGRALSAAGFVVATGGGPGAMEAANLGAYLGQHAPEAVGEAIELLATAPLFHPSVTDWARVAFAVRRRWPDGTSSLGIPTWFYGHEPPNAFATEVAKYFQNALREDQLLRVCDGGIVFLPGAAGTVQEIFQDACENYYAAPEGVAAMVLVGMRHWTEEVPAWPLLVKLAAQREMASKIFLVDRVEEVPTLLSR
jgi:predicted Rossmann-fold nucleotide-binding protein